MSLIPTIYDRLPYYNDIYMYAYVCVYIYA